MNFSELSRVIESVGKDKGVRKELIVEALEEAIVSAAKKKYGMTGTYEANYITETGEIELFQFKEVVDNDDVADDCKEIELDQAKELDPDAGMGDELGIKLENPDFGRIDAQNAKQIIFQKIREAEREIIYKEFHHRKGEVITGIARSYERGNIVVDLGKANAFLPKSESIPGEAVKPGDRVQAYLYDVLMTNRGPAIYLSRTSPLFLIKLFETEVPEIAEGLVEIRAAAREPGQRAKIAVISRDRDVDPVGACVGMRGVRVQAVVGELGGEKIDIVPWSEDLETFTRSALAPAEVDSMKVYTADQRMEALVDDDQLSLAIGRRGQNVRLAAMLTGWKIDIISKSKLHKKTQEAVFNLKHLEGVSDTLAALMFQMGIGSMKDVAEAEISELQKVPGYEEEAKAAALQENAKDVLSKGGDMMMIPEEEDGKVVSASAAPLEKFATRINQESEKTQAMENAEDRLKEELKRAQESEEI